jgi:hypothetical protein
MRLDLYSDILSTLFRPFHEGEPNLVFWVVAKIRDLLD